MQTCSGQDALKKSHENDQNVCLTSKSLELKTANVSRKRRGNRKYFGIAESACFIKLYAWAYLLNDRHLKQDAIELPVSALDSSIKLIFSLHVHTKGVRASVCLFLSTCKEKINWILSRADTGSSVCLRKQLCANMLMT
jgi:hypothetical protein